MTEIFVSETMRAVPVKTIKPVYLVIKIGENVFSTSFKFFDGRNFLGSELQRADTRNVGMQNNLWLKGVFVEKKNHQVISPLPFELNFYSDLKDGLAGDLKPFNPLDSVKVVCGCGEHLYCSKCGKFVWKDKGDEK